jgi:hypothetical protein
MADVFISYATEDRQRVKPIVEAIEQAGFSVTSALNGFFPATRSFILPGMSD